MSRAQLSFFVGNLFSTVHSHGDKHFAEICVRKETTERLYERCLSVHCASREDNTTEKISPFITVLSPVPLFSSYPSCKVLFFMAPPQRQQGPSAYLSTPRCLSQSMTSSSTLSTSGLADGSVEHPPVGLQWEFACITVRRPVGLHLIKQTNNQLSNLPNIYSTRRNGRKQTI